MYCNGTVADMKIVIHKSEFEYLFNLQSNQIYYILV